MSGFLDALGNHVFLQHALLAGILAAVGCGITGTYVLVRRITSLAGGISHAVLGGMGVAYFMGSAPIAGAVVAALAAALLIGWVHLRGGQQEDTLISALWSVGMAVGILFISKTPGYGIDLMSYLFGNILMVQNEQLQLMAVLDVVLLAAVMLCYKQFLAVCFDPEFARLRGIAANFYYLLLLCMVALTVVLLIQVVGIILVLALLVLPAATAAQFSRSLRAIMVMAGVLGMLFTGAGLAVSYATDLPTGSLIAVLAGGVYLIAIVSDNVVSAWRRRMRRVDYQDR